MPIAQPTTRTRTALAFSAFGKGSCFIIIIFVLLNIHTRSLSATAAVALRNTCHNNSRRSTRTLLLFQHSLLLPPTTKKSRLHSNLLKMSSSSNSNNNHEHVFPTNPTIQHMPDELLPDQFRPERTRILTTTTTTIEATKPNNNQKCVVYWMQRDVRAVDNWALILACHLGQEVFKLPIHVVYALRKPPPSPPVATAAATATAAAANDNGSDNEEPLPPTLIEMPMPARYGQFMLGGLEQVHKQLAEKKIPLHVHTTPLDEDDETVGASVANFLTNKLHAAAVVCDWAPLRHHREWMEWQAASILDEHQVPLYQVDAHNIVPVWTASSKRQVGARTLRPRIHKVLSHYLQDYPNNLIRQTAEIKTALSFPEFDRKSYETYLQMDDSVPPIESIQPGTAAAQAQFQVFVQNGLAKFDQLRNDPNYANICSNLSPWINHGHISFATLTKQVKKLNKYANGTAAYIEEGVVRRELSDNFVFYEPNHYDKLTGAADWAQDTLRVHADDPREYLYTTKELELGQTHDDLWNAAQLQVVREGGMHGFMRMYWAKKILEWTPSPEIALRTAQYFNDKYALDGMDPNGFVGVGWSIMGIHDMGWREREVFGKIRYMNYNGCKRKFKVADFVRKYNGASENAAAAADVGSKKETALPKKSSGSKRSTADAGKKKTAASAKKRKG